MAKRSAGNYLTDQNWEEDEEVEEAGVFKQADADIMQRRQIKKAVRRANTDEDGEKGSSFKGFKFSGFTKTNPSTAFSSLSSKPLTGTNGSESVADKSSLFSVSKTGEASITNTEEKKLEIKTTVTNGNRDSKTQKNSPKYFHQLKNLNEGVSRWIKEHVDENPYCILTPIFKDYEKYLAELEQKYPQQPIEEVEADKKSESLTKETKDSKSEIQKFSFSSTEKTTVAASSGFSVSKDTTASSSTTTSSTAPMFSFGSSSASGKTDTLGVKTTSTASGIFGTTSTSSSSSTAPSGFSFGGTSSGSVFGTTSGFSFGDAVKKVTEAGSSQDNADDEEYVPPKQEVAEIKEDDAFYSKKCKLFFKKDDQWKEKGVGNLHLKPCGKKTQLLVRADTSLGNILLNIMLSSSMPVSKQGKNNVAIVCVPNPPIDGLEASTMVPMLIRVKTSEDADEMIEKLKELKS